MARSILITDIAHFVGGPSARALLAEAYTQDEATIAIGDAISASTAAMR